jgi:hypothetical protein
MATSAGFSYSEPGFSDDRQSVENDVFFQTSFIGTPLYDPLGLVDSTAVDTLHTSYTGQLRAGLVMAKLTSTGAWVDYDPTANDGSQFACGILVRELYLLDPTTGSNVSKVGLIAVAGQMKAAGSNLIGLDRAARTSLRRQGFIFDDGPTVLDPASPWGGARYVTATATLTAADHGKLIVSNGAGAVVLTLPAIANGLVIEGQNIANQSFQFASAEGTNIIAVNNAGATSVTASTASQMIGAHFKVTGTYINGTLKWVFQNLSPGVVTITVA